FVADDERALIAGTAAGRVAASEEPGEPAGDRLLQLFARYARSRHAGLAIRGRRRDFPPASRHLGDRIACRRVVHHLPDVPRECRAHAFARRDAFERGAGIAQRGAVTVAPRGIENLVVLFQPIGKAALAGDGTESLVRIDLLDALNGGHFKTRFARLGEELD